MEVINKNYPHFFIAERKRQRENGAKRKAEQGVLLFLRWGNLNLYPKMVIKTRETVPVSLHQVFIFQGLMSASIFSFESFFSSSCGLHLLNHFRRH